MLTRYTVTYEFDVTKDGETKHFRSSRYVEAAAGKVGSAKVHTDVAAILQEAHARQHKVDKHHVSVTLTGIRVGEDVWVAKAPEHLTAEGAGAAEEVVTPDVGTDHEESSEEAKPKKKPRRKVKS